MVGSTADNGDLAREGFYPVPPVESLKVERQNPPLRERGDKPRTISTPTPTTIVRGECSELPLWSRGLLLHGGSAPEATDVSPWYGVYRFRINTEQTAVSPAIPPPEQWVSPNRALSICDFPASPLSCHTASATWASPVAPTG